LGLQTLAQKANSKQSYRLALVLAEFSDIDAILLLLNSPPPALSSTANSLPPRSAARQNQSAKGYSLEPTAGGLTPIEASPTELPTPNVPNSSHVADETALLTRGPDILSLTEYFTALDGVIEDLERMWKGLQEGRGGTREAGVKDLVGWTAIKMIETNKSSPS
jgi:exocyst complex protein 7